MRPQRKSNRLVVAVAAGMVAVVALIAVLAATSGRSRDAVALDNHPAIAKPEQDDDEPAPVENPATVRKPRPGRTERPVAAPDTATEPEAESHPSRPIRPDETSHIVPAKVETDVGNLPVKPATPPEVITPAKPDPVPQPAEPKPAEPAPKPPQPVPPGPAPELPVAADARLPEPAADELTAAKVQIKDVYGKEIAEAASPGLKRHLAAQFLKQADAASDPAPIRFGLYQTALHLASEAADVQLGLDAIDGWSAAFVVDPHAQRLQALQHMAKTAKPADQLPVGKAALDQVQRATEADELAVAEKLAQLAQTVATKTRDGELRRVATARLADLKKIEHLWNQAKSAAETLKQSPDDEAANLTYGSYLCLTHGDWPHGLPLLAKGSAGKLSAAARLDLEQPADSAAQLEAGDAWWSLASDDKTIGRPLLMERAGHWYQQALPHLTGLAQTRIEKRLAEIASHAHEEPLGRKTPTLTAGKQLDIPLAGDANSNAVLHLRWMPAGKFIQGSPPSEPGHQPFETQHEVVLTRPFFIGTTEVTQAQWQAVMGSNPSRFVGPDIPVHNVSYTAAKEFCERLDLLPATRGKYQFRLPTSAEWEFACRAGSKHTYCYGDDPGKLGEYAWYKDSQKGEGGPRPVGQLKPNVAGLYDMHGNVSEWCTDSFSNLILTTRQVDPKGFPGVNQVTRGGYGMSTAQECRCAQIFNDPPGKAIDGLGFRLVCEPVGPKKDTR